MELTSRVYRVSKINKKTRAQFFKDVKVGDLLQFSMTLKHRSGASGGGSYATYITIMNITQETITKNSQSQLVNLLHNFELEVQGGWSDGV